MMIGGGSDDADDQHENNENNEEEEVKNYCVGALIVTRHQGLYVLRCWSLRL